MVDLQFDTRLREKSPLISDAFLKRVTLWISVLALLTLALNFLGQWYSGQMQRGTHTPDNHLVDIFIGPDHLRIPANAIRFPEQRIPGEVDTLSLYLSWPELEGYTETNQAAFNRISNGDRLIFLQLSQSTMTLDMSGRFRPIYARLFSGKAEAGPHGLSLYRFKQSSGFGSEVMLAAKTSDQEIFAIRCLFPDGSNVQAGSDCQRDIAVGNDLSVLYRYPVTILKDWQAIDAAVKQYITNHLVANAAPGANNTKAGRISR